MIHLVRWFQFVGLGIRPNGNDGFDIITDGPVDSGEFTLLPVGDYKVGLWIGPESGYTMSAEGDADFSKLLKTQPLVSQ